MADRCDYCHEHVSEEAARMGWPIPMPGGEMCPDCYGDGAFCPAGHVLDGHSDGGWCETCAARLARNGG